MQEFLEFIRQIQQETLLLRLWQSGRELLHSNVLAYLLESSEHRARLLAYLWGPDEWDRFHVRALREQNGIDLLVVMLPKAPDPQLLPETETYWRWVGAHAHAIDARVLAIENKFKSLPDQAQLQGYSEALHADRTEVFARKLGWYLEAFSAGEELEAPFGPGAVPYLVANCRKVILTPTEGDNIEVSMRVVYTAQSGAVQRRQLPAPEQGQRADIWESRGWMNVAQLLQGTAPAAGLEGEFLQSYARMLIASTGLQALLRHYTDGPHPFAFLDALRQHAQPMRLWDFIDKWRYEFLTLRVRGALQENAAWQEVRRVASSRGISLHFAIPEAQATAVVGTFFSRNTGGTDIGLFRAADETVFALEVQLQGATLKLMLAFAGAAENAQRVAASAGLQTLIAAQGQIAEVLAAVPEPLSTYRQRVGVGVAPHGRDPDALAIEQQEGRLLYASSQMWQWNGGQADGAWAMLSCSQLAERLAAIAVETVNHWDAVAAAIAPHYPVT